MIAAAEFGTNYDRQKEPAAMADPKPSRLLTSLDANAALASDVVRHYTMLQNVERRFR